MKCQNYKEIEMNIVFLNYFDSIILKEVIFFIKKKVKNRFLFIKWMLVDVDIFLERLVAFIWICLVIMV